MTRTLLIIVSFACFVTLAAALNARADAPTTSADQPAAAPADDQHAPADNDRPGERLRQRMRDGRPGPGNPGERAMGPGGPGGPRGDGNRPAPLSAEQQQQVMSVLSEINPDLADKIKDAQKSDPNRAAHILQRFGPRLLPIAQLQESDPDLYKLTVADQRYNFETFRIVRQLRQARTEGDDARVQRLTSRLRDVLNKHFDVRTKLREHELAMLEQRIADLRAELKDHHDRKQQLIEEEVTRMTAENVPPRDGDDDGKPGDERNDE